MKMLRGELYKKTWQSFLDVMSFLYALTFEI